MTYFFGAFSTITFLIWGLDKFRAKTGAWRIPEKFLLTLTVLGGAFGALAGMILFRHKTRKIHFWLIVIICCLIHGFLWLTNS